MLKALFLTLPPASEKVNELKGQGTGQVAETVKL